MTRASRSRTPLFIPNPYFHGAPCSITSLPFARTDPANAPRPGLATFGPCPTPLDYLACWMSVLAITHRPVVSVCSSSVLVIREHPQMAWIHARPVFALVIQRHSQRHLSMHVHPCCAVSQHDVTAPVLLPSDLRVPVRSSRITANPAPCAFLKIDIRERTQRYPRWYWHRVPASFVSVVSRAAHRRTLPTSPPAAAEPATTAPAAVMSEAAETMTSSSA